MHSTRRVLFFMLLLVLASCKKSSDRADTYFDSLIVAQVKYLSIVNPSLTKIAKMDGKEAHSTFHPDSTIWKNELDIFRHLALFERASYRDAYKLEDGLNDTKSNLLIKRYVSRKELPIPPIPELKFYYYQELRNLKKIEAIYQQGNALYATTRRLVLEFDEVKGKPVLSAYAIEGSEKMILSDSVKFSIQSRINYSF
jgi:hypothetical protein